MRGVDMRARGAAGRTGRAVGAGLLAVGLLAAAVGLVWPAVAALLIGFLLATRQLEGPPFVGAAMLTAAGLVVVAVRSGLTAADLGLAPDSLLPGLLWSLGIVLLVGAGVAVGLRVPRLRRYFHDQRHRGPGSVAARRALVDVPFGTVLLEELAFRGVVLALLVREIGTPWAVVVSSLLFGLWHVLGAWDTRSSVLGTVAATTGAGAVFALLRVGIGSLLPPAALHWALNGFGTAAGWHVTRRGAA